MREQADGGEARDLGERAGETSRELLPVIGDFLAGVWDGLWTDTPAQGSEAYATGHAVGSAIPRIVEAIWDFLVGFISGLTS